MILLKATSVLTLFKIFFIAETPSPSVAQLSDIYFFNLDYVANIVTLEEKQGSTEPIPHVNVSKVRCLLLYSIFILINPRKTFHELNCTPGIILFRVTINMYACIKKCIS